MNSRASAWYSFSLQTSRPAASAISADVNKGRIIPRLAVASTMMMTAVSGARTTPVN